ncbi:PREDICTED: tetratricopeptide repeat protein 38 [Nelumbo nucifera]|uniref:Tetratricopeptide repeat protein 38 n=1 Tax=Nelumbo nucifera TaxID=4432 RepID=A0A1U8A3Z8_NELNU|nr:PREDICTED: tetratricopeptide repeat protein 38 [Nelumbo nucifera]
MLREVRVKLDKWGYEVNTSSDACIASINSFYHEVLSYGRHRAVILEAPVHDKDCVLGNILAAHYLSSHNPALAPFHLAAAKSHHEHATPYEKEVFEVISYMVTEDRDDDVVVDLHSKLLKGFPKDLVSLKRAQVFCFYMGRPDLSLDLVEQVLAQNQQENYIYGMLSFPLLELGRMADAEKAAQKGFGINKNDSWSQHALCHVYQYDGRFKEAVEFMEECSPSWGSCSSFMYTHNWWHVAVCYLEGHSPINKVLEVYDKYIWKELEKGDAVPGEVYLNALGLLLRVHVRGQIAFFEDRLKILVDRLVDRSTWHMEWHLDLLILWALSNTKETDKAEDLLNAMKARFYLMSKKKQLSMQRGIKLAEALYEYGRGKYEEAFHMLAPDFDASYCKTVGASDEQLDVFNEVWCSILLNTGRASEAIKEIEKRIQKREGIPFLWRLLERGYSMAGREDVAVVSEKAKALEAAYFKQLV